MLAPLCTKKVGEVLFENWKGMKVLGMGVPSKAGSKNIDEIFILELEIEHSHRMSSREK